jgi:hypothetical protein
MTDHPTFIIMGAPKSGSTTLYHGLRQHPDVFMSEEKEPRYFSYLAVKERKGSEPRNPSFFPVRTAESYARLFEEARGRVTGEASVNYLEIPGTAEVIHRLHPEVRLIAILRNPVDRAFSHYLMNVRGGFERQRFEEALADETYLKTGLYSRQLQAYLDRFDPRHLHIALMDELKHDPVGLLQRLYVFVGVDPAFVPDLAFQHNVGGAPKSRLLNLLFTQSRLNDRLKRALPDVVVRGMIRLKRTNYAPVSLPEDTRSRLVEYYREDIGALEALTGRDLQHWLD